MAPAAFGEPSSRLGLTEPKAKLSDLNGIALVSAPRAEAADMELRCELASDPFGVHVDLNGFFRYWTICSPKPQALPGEVTVTIRIWAQDSSVIMKVVDNVTGMILLDKLDVLPSSSAPVSGLPAGSPFPGSSRPGDR